MYKLMSIAWAICSREYRIAHYEQEKKETGKATTAKTWFWAEFGAVYLQADSRVEGEMGMGWHGNCDLDCGYVHCQRVL